MNEVRCFGDLRHRRVAYRLKHTLGRENYALFRLWGFDEDNDDPTCSSNGCTMNA